MPVQSGQSCREQSRVSASNLVVPNRDRFPVGAIQAQGIGKGLATQMVTLSAAGRFALPVALGRFRGEWVNGAIGRLQELVDDGTSLDGTGL